MELDQEMTTQSGTTYYVSISREYNGRIKLSCSAHYTAPADEGSDVSGGKLSRAIATSLTVGALAQASVERILEDTTNDRLSPAVDLFIALVNESASTICQKIGA
jgi:hypothetical protein